jgi:signal transduction histidine kinase
MKKKTDRDPQTEPEVPARRRSYAATDHTSDGVSKVAYNFLDDAALQLSASLDYETTIATITRLAVPMFADYCLVDLLTPSGRLCRVAAVHAELSDAVLLKQEFRYAPDPQATDHPVAKVLRTQQPEIGGSQAAASNAEHLRVLHELGATSGIVVPLIAQEQLIGALSLGRAFQDQHYPVADLTLAQLFARHAASALVNARRYKDAQEGMRAREQFLSIAAHELKTPLTTLLGSIEHLQRRISRMEQAQERDQHIAQRIRDQTIRLTQMVDSLLDIARVDGGRLYLARAPLDLVALTRRLMAELQPTSPQHRFTLAVLDDPLIVYADALRLEQVLHNLLGNALKYSPQGGTITVQLAQQGGMAVMAVMDQGIGIPQAAQPYLFERFFRAPNVEQQQIDGIGLGLAVVKEIVTLHGGEVEVASEEGCGSTFTIFLPLHHAGSHAAEQPLSESALHSSLPHL